MNQPAFAPTDASTQAEPAPAPPFTVVRKVGRPTRFSTQLADGICALVQFEGYSDTQAGLLVGVPRATLSRWKAEEEDFAFQLEQARALFQRAHVLRVLEAKRSDGTPDWRASAWLLQRMFPEQYGPAGQQGRGAAAPSEVTSSISFKIAPQEGRLTSRHKGGQPPAAEAGESEGPNAPSAVVCSVRSEIGGAAVFEDVEEDEREEVESGYESSLAHPQIPQPRAAQLRSPVRAQVQLGQEGALRTSDALPGLGAVLGSASSERLGAAKGDWAVDENEDKDGRALARP